MVTAQGCNAVVLRRGLVTACCFVALSLATPLGRAIAQDVEKDESSAPHLSQQIDALLQPPVSSLLANKEADGKLLRRLSLDLRGVVPTREELDAFAADSSEQRWAAWVDRFLQDPLCDEHLVTFLDRTLMLRRAHGQVDRASWLGYLRDHVAAGTSLDALSRELLYTPWWNRDHRTAQRFYLDRGGDPHLITRDLARVFLGRDLQCAQCHDHPLVNDFRQVDYHGLMAFVSAGSLAEVTYKDAENKDQKVQLYIEKAAGDAPFESVFERGTLLRSGARLSGQPEAFDDYQLPDQRYLEQAPEGAMAGAPLPPKFSRREQLANRLADRDNSAFVTNWANRLWALVFGRGLVHPLDMMEPDNPPSHPELLDLISEGLRLADMRLKPFLRELVMTEAYQRGDAPELLRKDVTAVAADAANLRSELEQRLALASSELEALSAAETSDSEAYDAAREAWLKLQADRTAVRAELDTAEAAMLDAKKKHEEANAALAAAQKKQADSQARATLLDESAAKLEQALALTGGEDAELSQAIAVAKQRAEAARAQAPELEKGVSDAQTASTAAATTLQQATAGVEQVVGKLKPIQISLQAADQATVAARSKWFDTRSASVAARRKLAQIQRLIEWVDGRTKSEQLAQSMTALDEQLAQGQARTAKMLTSMEAAKASLAAAQQEMQTAGQELASAEQAVETHRLLISTLEKTVSQIADATKLVAKVEPLTAAQQTLREEIAGKQMELGQIQANLETARTNLAAKTELTAQRKAAVEAATAEHQQHTAQLASLQENRVQQQTQLDELRASIETLQQSIAEDSETQLASAGLHPLTAEQLCWSTLRVTGVLDAYIRTELAELEKASPLPADADEATRDQRQRQALRQAIEKLRGIADHYVSLYASGPDKTHDDYFASADQALYVANGGSVFNWAAPGNNNPTQHAASLTDPTEVAKVLYWSYLGRQPTAEETALVTEQLASAGDQRNAILQEMAWSLLASAEFRFTR